MIYGTPATTSLVRERPIRELTGWATTANGPRWSTCTAATRQRQIARTQSDLAKDELKRDNARRGTRPLAAAAGANLRELMERMGHSTTRAAMVYLHSTDERQRKVADALGDLARAGLGDDKKRGTARAVSGTDLARRAAKGKR